MTLETAFAEALRRVIREEVEPLRRAVAELRADATPPASAISVAEAAGRMKVSTRTVKRLVQAGQLQSVKVGRSRRILVASLPGAGP